MESLVKDFLKQKNFAVVGSFRNESKVAWKILRTLRAKGIRVYPVNPAIKEIDGIPCKPNISDIKESIDVVNIVMSPSVTEKIIMECCRRGIKKVWLQPGAESKEAIEFCKNNNLEVIYGLCIMLKAI